MNYYFQNQKKKNNDDSLAVFQYKNCLGRSSDI